MICGDVLVGRKTGQIVYSMVGGMPDAVKTYIETKDIREVDGVQWDIMTLYKDNFYNMNLKTRNLS